MSVCVVTPDGGETSHADKRVQSQKAPEKRKGCHLQTPAVYDHAYESRERERAAD